MMEIMAISVMKDGGRGKKEIIRERERERLSLLIISCCCFCISSLVAVFVPVDCLFVCLSVCLYLFSLQPTFPCRARSTFIRAQALNISSVASSSSSSSGERG